MANITIPLPQEWHMNHSGDPIMVLLDKACSVGGFRFSDRFRGLCERRGLMEPGVPDGNYRGVQEVVRLARDELGLGYAAGPGCSFVVGTVGPWLRWRARTRDMRTLLTGVDGGASGTDGETNVTAVITRGNEVIDTEWPWQEVAMRLMHGCDRDDPLVEATHDHYGRMVADMTASATGVAEPGAVYEGDLEIDDIEGPAA